MTIQYVLLVFGLAAVVWLLTGPEFKQRVKSAWQSTVLKGDSRISALSSVVGLASAVVTILSTYLYFLNPDLAATAIGDELGMFWNAFLAFCSLLIGVLVLLFFWTFGVSLYNTYTSSLSSILKRLPLKDSTESFRRLKAGGQNCCGGVIEVFVAENFDIDPSDNGWDAAHFIVRKVEDAPAVHAELDGTIELGKDSKNGKKYWLIGRSTTVMDNMPNVSLSVTETDFAHTEFARTKVDESIVAKIINPDTAVMNARQLRHQLMQLEPSPSGIPAPLCLHFSVLLSDGNVLTLRRKDFPHTSYYPGALSVSFEEQLSDLDFRGHSSASENWFRRAIGEEVFPARKKINDDDLETREFAWKLVSQYVSYYRYQSLLLEEETGGYAAFGICGLNVDLDGFIAASNKIEAILKDVRDDEGNIGFMTQTQLSEFLRTGSANYSIINFRNPKSPVLRREQNERVHPSSAYRAGMIRLAVPV